MRPATTTASMGLLSRAVIAAATRIAAPDSLLPSVTTRIGGEAIS
jgi:hypothetical protein